MRQPLVKRTGVLLAVMATAALLLACGSDGDGSGGGAPAVPSTVSVHADPALAEDALAAARDIAGARGVSVEEAVTADGADIVITGVRPASGDAVEVVTRYWVAVVALPHPARALMMDQLGDIIDGSVTDWSAVTGQAQPVHVVVPLEVAPPINQWWPGRVTIAQPGPLADIPGALYAEPGTLALVQLDAVDVHMGTLDVDGANAVFGRGDIDAYPLVERAWIVSESDGSLQGELAEGVSLHLAATKPDPIILRATGDIIPARCAFAKQRDAGDYRHAFIELGPWLAEADITVGSLDAAVSDAGEPFGCEETLSLLAPAATVEGFSFAGFDVMTVATNHVKDCGRAACGDDAFFDTLANLRAAGIEPVGGGANLTEAREPAVLTVEGVTFAFLGYDEIASYYHAEPDFAGTAPLTEAHVREDVAAAAAIADVVVVLPQWGVEYTADPTFGQRALAQTAVDAGAGLVIGNHPHWVQAAEVLDGTFVAYALGNFVFDQDWSRETQQGAVLEVAFHGVQLKAVDYRPVRIVDEHQPMFAGPDEARQILDRIWTASEELTPGLAP